MSEIITESFKYIASVRFQNTKKPYTFGANDETLEYGDFVVVETARGLEIGEMISSLRDASSFTGQTALKPIHRKASHQDRQMHTENKELAKEALKKCAECVQKHELDMNLISAEYTLDRSRLIFVYVSENRVDFRELLKDLSQIFKCRIELRQIGPRDKAKMVGGLGACGLETCCSRFLDSFDVVSINMAKNQLLALNIPKLSGQCGKLMCCLKYEDEAYKELRVGLPKMNSQIEFEGRMYRLTSMNVITRQIKLENKENAVFMSIDDLLSKTSYKKPTVVPIEEEASVKVDEKLSQSTEETEAKEEKKQEHRNNKNRHNNHKKPNQNANTNNAENQANGENKKPNNNKKRHHRHNPNKNKGTPQE